MYVFLHPKHNGQSIHWTIHPLPPHTAQMKYPRELALIRFVSVLVQQLPKKTIQWLC